MNPFWYPAFFLYIKKCKVVTGSNIKLHIKGGIFVISGLCYIIVLFREKQRKTKKKQSIFCFTSTSHGIALAYFVYFHITTPLHKGSTVMSWILLKDHSFRSRLFIYILVSRHELTTAMQRL